FALAAALSCGGATELPSVNDDAGASGTQGAGGGGGSKTDSAMPGDASPDKGGAVDGATGQGDTPVSGSCPALSSPGKFLHVEVELAVGDTRAVTLTDGTEATLQLLKLDERLNAYSQFIETARVQVSVNGEQKWIEVGEYTFRWK